MPKKSKLLASLQALALCSAFGLASSAQAQAGYFEVTSGFSYSRSKYSEESYSWTRRVGASVGYHFTDRSELEFSFSDTLDRNIIHGYEDTTFHDQVFSLNWVQSLTGKDFPIQPYVKGGIGQLNRDASGSYAGGGSPSQRVDAITAIVGGGLRIYLTKSFAIRGEVSSYLSGGAISTWKDNIGTTIGLSVYF